MEQRFSRLVVGLQPSVSRAALEFAADLARRLHLRLVGLAAKDTEIGQLVGLPFVREFRALGGGWQPIDFDRLASDFSAALRRTEREFAEIAGRVDPSSRVDLVRGTIARALETISEAADIVVVAEPAAQFERTARLFTALVDAAFRSPAAVLLVPPTIARMHGPVAVMRNADAACMEIATSIAAAIGEELIVLERGETGSDRASIPIYPASAAAGSPSGGSRVRLLICDRTALDRDVALRILSRRRVPLLITEPSERRTSTRADEGK